MSQVVLQLLDGPKPVEIKLGHVVAEARDGYLMFVHWADDRTGELQTSGPSWDSLQLRRRVWQLTGLEVVVDATELPQPA